MARNYQPSDVMVLLSTFNEVLNKIEIKFKTFDDLKLSDLKEAITELKSAAGDKGLTDLATKTYIDKALEDKVDKVKGSSLATAEQLAQIASNNEAIQAIQKQLEGVEATLTSLNERMGKVV